MTYRYFVLDQGVRVYLDAPSLVVHTTGDGFRTVHRAQVETDPGFFRPLLAEECGDRGLRYGRAPVYVEFTPRALHHTMLLRPGAVPEMEYVPALLPGL